MNNEKGLSTNAKGLLAAISCYTIFGLSFIFSRIALSNTSPEVMLSIRFAVALLVMSALLLFRVIKINLKGKQILPLIALGMCQPVLYFFCESYGIKYTNASFSGMMIALIPVVSSLMSAIILKEELKKNKLMWILGSVVGAIIITIAGSTSGSVQMIGLICIIGAVLLASIFGVMSRKYSEQFSALEITYIMLVLGFVSFTVVALIKEGSSAGIAYASALTNKNVMLPIIYLSVLSSIVAFFLQNYSLATLPIQRSMVFANMVPVVSAIAGVLFLGEPCTIIHVIGMVIIVISIYMVNRS